ncbi:MAG TPA: type II secretion system F family protein [Candidatus Hydrogenedentes bacterium]|nr:type II secretion system F family protein [Candidatus Hydrogenedentota bacterium]HOV73550.1 type II secretion system F family protein [Candidatus Hydrogenedentota bacterium]HPC16552.1 type II secretion system F family protein [Candidatus Hydrogenedentota bacterium]HRT18949.1 type II secretion system F family protein [Candidatus Hydrogenedentota bacterium]HRT64939.1 type II secretion system F family protein [Candidatus Hydrogenedentota bacterium]
MEVIKQKKKRTYFRASRWRNDLLVLTAQIAELIRANAPLPGGLLALASEAPSPALRDVLLAVRQDIVSGLSLSDALGRRTDFFPEYYVELVRNGEKSGQLEQAFARIEEGLVQLSAFSDKLRNYALYIGIVFFIELFLAIQLCLFIVPQFVTIFGGFGQSLPFVTQTLLGVSRYLNRWEAYVFLAVALVIAVALWRNLPFLSNRRTALQRFLGRLSLHIPFVRYMVSRRDLSHVASVLRDLLSIGTPLDTALENAAQLDINPAYREALARVKKRIEQGISLKTALNAESRVLPDSFLGVIALGENAGSLPDILGRVSTLYRDDAVKTAHIFLDIAAPAAVCALGTLVFWLYSGIFSAVFSLPTLVR